jgi:ABC-2 type transport system permease protein
MEPRVWYNPELRSTLFLVPGLIAYIAMLTAVVSTALSIVREKEAGTMEQVRMAPITPVAYVLGLLISTVAETQQVAFQVALLTSYLPTLMLSGFIFPIASMPPFLQLVTYAVPARYFIVALRGIVLKGVGPAVF